jgi:hypothetical protein
MLTRTFMRSIAAVAILALAVGDSTLIGAQPRVGADGQNAPQRIADCDFTLGNCGNPGGEIYGPGDGGGNSSGGGLVCGAGAKVKCNTTTVRTCVSWRVTGGSVEFSVSDPAGLTLEAGARLSCETWSSTTVYWYWG